MAKMISEEQIDLLVERLIRRTEQANIYFLMKLGESIKKIKELSPSDAQQLVQILKYGGNYEEIIQELAKYSNLNIADIDKIFSNYSKIDTSFSERFYKYRDLPFVPFEENNKIKSLTEAFSNIVKNEMYNFTRSNVLGYTFSEILPNGKKGKVGFYGLKETYNRVLDEALVNIGQGKETFDSAMSRIMEEIGGSGLKTIQFESGRSMRLDSAIRMQLRGRLRELHNENQKIIGEEIDSDGIEITVHSNPAPDHELAQGHQFSNEEYEKLNRGEKATDYKGIEITLDHDGKNGYRPISEMNCYHYIFTIVLGVSEPEYTDEELQKIIDEGHKKIKIDDKEYTKYECSQLQRNLERKIREQKDIQIFAKSGNNIELAQKADKKILQLTNKYYEISEKSGLPTKLERLKVNNYKSIAKSKLK